MLVRAEADGVSVEFYYTQETPNWILATLLASWLRIFMALYRPSRETTGQQHQTGHKSLLQVFTIHNLSWFSNLKKFIEFLYLKYKVSLSLEAPNYCLCIQPNSVSFSFVNTGKQVHLKDARRHFERNLVKDVHHRSVASRNWLKS